MLDKKNKNYYYNLGRVVSIVEIMNGLDATFVNLVYDNANDKLPFQLREALSNSRHNIHHELIDPADIVLNQGELPKKILEPSSEGCKFWLGYYHEKKYLTEAYSGIFGNVETQVLEHTPIIITDEYSDNNIDSLKK